MTNFSFVLLLCLLVACDGKEEGGGGQTTGGGTSGGSTTGGTTTSPFKSNDPLFDHQWHLVNSGQTSFAKNGGVAGIDINLAKASTNGIKGNGVLIAVSDTGIEIGHEDLSQNYSAAGSKNFLLASPYTGDPTTDLNDSDNNHGTAVTGIIAAAGDNVKGGRGIAPAAKFGGFNFLATGVQQSLDRILFQMAGNFDIFNYSYGVSSVQYRPMGSSARRTSLLNAYKEGVQTGRSGKGSIYVKAAGNEFKGSVADDANIGSGWAEVYLGNSAMLETNSYPYTIIVGALNAKGIKSSYSNPGSNLWISAPGGEYGTDDPAIVTTDFTGCSKGYSDSSSTLNTFDKGTNALNSGCNYTSTMNGTSAATPAVAGVVALILQANPNLTWRDVKHILAATAKVNDPGVGAYTHPLGKDLSGHVYQQKWVTNAAGFKFHNHYGFGMVDASAATDLAKSYNILVGPFRETGWGYDSGTLDLAIPNASPAGVTHAIDVKHNYRIEGIQIKATLAHEYIDNIGIELTSPSGTKSIILNVNSNTLDLNLEDAMFLTNAFYGEKSVGNWTIKVIDALDVNPDLTRGAVGKLTNWKINILGHIDEAAQNALAPDKVGAITNANSSASLTSSPYISWPESPSPQLLRYEYCLGSNSQLCDVVAWSSNGSNNSLQLNNLTLIDGRTYYINVRVVDVTEKNSQVTSSSWLVSTAGATAPTGPNCTISPIDVSCPEYCTQIYKPYGCLEDGTNCNINPNDIGCPGTSTTVSPSWGYQYPPSGVPAGACSETYVPDGVVNAFNTRKGTITLAGATAGDIQYAPFDPDANKLLNTSSMLKSVAQAKVFFMANSVLKFRVKVKPQPAAAQAGELCYGRKMPATTIPGYTKLQYFVKIYSVDANNNFSFLDTRGPFTTAVNSCSAALDLAPYKELSPGGVVITIDQVKANQSCAGSFYTTAGFTDCNEYKNVRSYDCWSMDFEVAADGTRTFD